MGKIVAASKIVVLGASYREDVGDTRYSGSEALIREIGTDPYFPAILREDQVLTGDLFMDYN